jgi:hypothetical protein
MSDGATPEGVARKANGRFTAKLGNLFLGQFATAEEAAAAYVAAVAEYRGEDVPPPPILEPSTLEPKPEPVPAPEPPEPSAPKPTPPSQVRKPRKPTSADAATVRLRPGFHREPGGTVGAVISDNGKLIDLGEFANGTKAVMAFLDKAKVLKDACQKKGIRTLIQTLPASQNIGGVPGTGEGKKKVPGG